MIAYAHAQPLPRLVVIVLGGLVALVGAAFVRFAEPVTRALNASYAALGSRFRYPRRFVRTFGWIVVGFGVVAVMLSAALGH